MDVKMIEGEVHRGLLGLEVGQIVDVESGCAVGVAPIHDLERHFAAVEVKVVRNVEFGQVSELRGKLESEDSSVLMGHLLDICKRDAESCSVELAD